MTLKKTLWIILIATGVLAFTTALVALPDKGFAGAIAILDLMVWITYGNIAGYLTSLKRRVLRHLRTKAKQTEVVSRTVSARERVDVQMAIDRLAADVPEHKAYGCGAASLAYVVKNNAEPTTVQWVSLPKSLRETHPCATNAVYLLRHGDVPFAVLIQEGSSRNDVKQLQVEVMATTRQRAQDALDYLMKLANQRSVYRGSVVSLEKSPLKGEGYTIKFHDMPPVARDAIVLPSEVMEVVERNVLGLLKYGDVLRRSGRATRHGVLFHGPPGTGKTLVARYLANACADYTVILLTGRQLSLIRESCQLARLLAPSMVVLEDVDLVASERSRNRHNRVLHELLDEMDGLGSKSDCIFLLTTNRPDVLEPALAARPGRIDQAILFPLPDADCRRRLFDRFAAGLDVSQVDRESLVQRTQGASPAFIQELFRKAALMAAERGETATPLPVRDEDFTRALRELLEFGGELTRNLLGFTA